MKAKSKRKSKHQLAELREHRGVLKVALPSAIEGAEVVEIEVVTPVYNSDDLRVKHDEDTIARVLKYIVDKGFDDDLRRPPRDPELPRHVYKRGNRLMALLPGDKKKRTAIDVDQARTMLEHEDQDPAADLDGSPCSTGESDGEANVPSEADRQAGDATVKTESENSEVEETLADRQVCESD